MRRSSPTRQRLTALGADPLDVIEHRNHIAFGPQFSVIRHGKTMGFVTNLLDQPQSFGVARQNQRLTDVFPKDMLKFLGQADHRDII